MLMVIILILLFTFTLTDLLQCPHFTDVKLSSKELNNAHEVTQSTSSKITGTCYYWLIVLLNLIRNVFCHYNHLVPHLKTLSSFSRLCIYFAIKIEHTEWSD
jgi:hypothetical protein